MSTSNSKASNAANQPPIVTNPMNHPLWDPQGWLASDPYAPAFAAVQNLNALEAEQMEEDEEEPMENEEEPTDSEEEDLEEAPFRGSNEEEEEEEDLEKEPIEEEEDEQKDPEEGPFEEEDWNFDENKPEEMEMGPSNGPTKDDDDT